MEIRISVEKILPLEQGVSKSGNAWRKLSFIGKTFDEYPKQIAFILFNDNVEKYQSYVQQGNDLNVSFDIASREWVDSKGNSRWSTDVTVWKVEQGATAAPAPQQPVQPQPTQQPPVPPVPPVQMGNLSQQEMDAAAAAFFGSQPNPQPSTDLPF